MNRNQFANILKNMAARNGGMRPPSSSASSGPGNGPQGAMISRGITMAALLATGLAFVGSAIYNVEGGHRAVIFNRLTGVKNSVVGEGTHLLLPWLERATIYDVRARPRKIEALTGSKDLQMVNITLRVLSRVNTENLPQLHRELGLDYDERILPSIVQEVLKSVVALFNASQLITQRERVSRMIRDRLVERAMQFNIILDDVAIMHVAFGKEFTAAVEAKQVAQQEAQRAAFVVDKAIQEKQSIIVRAEGEAQAATMIGNAIKSSPSFLELRRIEAARDVASTISQSENRVFLDANTLLLNINTTKVA